MVGLLHALSQLNEKSTIGIPHAQSQLDKNSAIALLSAESELLAETLLGLTSHEQKPPPAFRRLRKRFRPKKEFQSEFNLACNDCLSTLLPHASHYSQELVNLLLEQQRTTQLPNIYVKPAMIGPYLEVTILFLDKRSNQLMSY